MPADRSLSQSHESLTPIERERLCHIVETACEVWRPAQFFLWAQGALQGLIAHEILVCAHGDLSRRSLAFFRCSSVPIPEAHVSDLEDLDAGLALQAFRAWAVQGEGPLLLAPGVAPVEAALRPLEAAVKRWQWSNLVVHGTPGVAGHGATYFMFGRVAGPVNGRLGRLVDLVLPQLHLAFLRVMTAEAAEASLSHRADTPLTAREVQILQWVRDGKSNADVAAILDISPLTVKNHMQKILRKLNVQNRAQAVARAIARRLIDSEYTRGA
jgi:transcriptional regulator EpsA